MFFVRYRSNFIYSRLRVCQPHRTMTSFEDLPILHFSSVTSTMDVAKCILNETDKTYFAVLADDQTKGRGSKGRNWISGASNLYLSVVFPLKRLSIPLSLLPLRIGVLISDSIRNRVTSGANINVKWPNDVLVSGKKISGVLIEIEDGNIVIGIGCNIVNAPTVPIGNGSNGSGRPSTCLAEHSTELQRLLYASNSNGCQNTMHSSSNCDISGSSSNRTRSIIYEIDKANCIPEISTSEGATIDGTTGGGGGGDCIINTQLTHPIAADICDRIHRWLSACNDRTDLVLTDFQERMDWSVQTIRSEIMHGNAVAETVPQGNEASMGLSGETKSRQIQPLRINDDGTLLVRYLDDNTETSLSAEYLW